MWTDKISTDFYGWLRTTWLGAGNGTWVFSKSIMCFSPLSHLSTSGSVPSVSNLSYLSSWIPSSSQDSSLFLTSECSSLLALCLPLALRGTSTQGCAVSMCYLLARLSVSSSTNLAMGISLYLILHPHRLTNHCVGPGGQLPQNSHLDLWLCLLSRDDTH